MKLSSLLQEVVDEVSLRHQYKDETVPQFYNFYDDVDLRGFSSFDLTLGVHMRENYGHIIFIQASLEEVVEDTKTEKKMQPFCVFELKVSKQEKFALMKGGTNGVDFSKLSHEEFLVYIEIQRLVYNKVR
jgi:hypothetical protein